MSFNGNQEASFSNIAADTAAFTLRGGRYGVEVMGTGFGTVSLQRLAADGTTYVDCFTAFSANGYQAVDLPPGTYRFHIATTTAVYATVTGIAITQ